MPMPVTFTNTEIDGVREVRTGSVGDARGYFAEVYSRHVWEAQGFAETFKKLERRG